MKTAIIYARYSSERQTEQSIDGQLRVCNEFAARNDLVVVNTYIDRATTGTNDNRVAFQKMLRDSAKKAWEVVLVYKIDRFSRNKYETATNKRTLQDNGVKLVSAMENIPDTPEGIILESLLEGMAEYYSAELSQKVKRGLNESRIKGNFTGGHLPYGYKVVDKKLLPDEERAYVVKYIFEQCAAGEQVKGIIKNLHEQGIMYGDRLIARNTVYNILRNEKYSGVYTIDGADYGNLYPQLISTELFNIVRQKIDSNKYGKHSLTVNFLLRKKLYCGYCGQPISGETGTSRNGDLKRYYKCLGRKMHNGCVKNNVRKELLEAFLVDIVYATLGDAKILEKLVDKILQQHTLRNKQQSILSLLIAEKNDTIKQINNFMTAIGKGIFSSSTKRRLDELEILRVDIDGKISIETAKLAVQLSKKDIVEYFHSALQENPQQMISLLIDRVVLYEDRIDVFYKFTEKESPDDNSQGSLLYTYDGVIPVPIVNQKALNASKMEINLLN